MVRKKGKSSMRLMVLGLGLGLFFSFGCFYASCSIAQDVEVRFAELIELLCYVNERVALFIDRIDDYLLDSIISANKKFSCVLSKKLHHLFEVLDDQNKEDAVFVAVIIEEQAELLKEQLLAIISLIGKADDLSSELKVKNAAIIAVSNEKKENIICLLAELQRTVQKALLYIVERSSERVKHASQDVKREENCLESVVEDAMELMSQRIVAVEGGVEEACHSIGDSLDGTVERKHERTMQALALYQKHVEEALYGEETDIKALNDFFCTHNHCGIQNVDNDLVNMVGECKETITVLRQDCTVLEYGLVECTNQLKKNSFEAIEEKAAEVAAIIRHCYKYDKDCSACCNKSVSSYIGAEFIGLGEFVCREAHDVVAEINKAADETVVLYTAQSHCLKEHIDDLCEQVSLELLDLESQFSNENISLKRAARQAESAIVNSVNVNLSALERELVITGNDLQGIIKKNRITLESDLCSRISALETVITLDDSEMHAAVNNFDRALQESVACALVTLCRFFNEDTIEKLASVDCMEDTIISALRTEIAEASAQISQLYNVWSSRVSKLQNNVTTQLQERTSDALGAIADLNSVHCKKNEMLRAEIISDVKSFCRKFSEMAANVKKALTIGEMSILDDLAGLDADVLGLNIGLKTTTELVAGIRAIQAAGIISA